MTQGFTQALPIPLPLSKGGTGLVSPQIPVQIVVGYAAAANGTSSIPNDNTIPQNTEGTEICTVSITPKNATNILVCKASIRHSNSSNTNNTLAMFYTTLIPNAAVADLFIAGTTDGVANLQYQIVAGALTTRTFSVRIGSGAGTWYVNSNSSAITFGNVIDDGFAIEVTEWTP